VPDLNGNGSYPDPTRGGRPTLLTEELTEAICEHLRDGLFLETTCRLLNLSYGTVYEWISRGENRHVRPPTPATRAFAAAVRDACAVAEERSLTAIRRGDPAWKAHAWYLERRFPSRWSARRLDPEPVEKAGRELAEMLERVLHDPSVALDPEQLEAVQILLADQLQERSLVADDA
jgi:transposase